MTPLKANISSSIITVYLKVISSASQFGLKLINIIDYSIVYNTTGAHAAELRGGTFRLALELTNQSPSCISEGGPSQNREINRPFYTS